MPLYHYLCKDCNKDFEIRHRYREKGIVCLYCNTESIIKYLGNTVSVVKKVITKKEKVGSEVYKAIEDGKQELEKAKNELAGKVYKKNE